MFGPITISSFINFSKVTTAFFIALLVYAYQAATLISFVYLAMYVSYAICWLMKSIVFPNKNFNKTLNLKDIVIGVPILFGVYW